MPIWTYRECGSHKSQTDHSEHIKLTNNCTYCVSPMLVLAGTAPPDFAHKGMNAQESALLGCPTCGWWSASSLLAAAPFETYDGGFCEFRRISGVLRNLNLSDLSVPTEELRSYLLARYGDRFNVHPKRYEEIVAGVFSDFGFRVRVTSYSGDEGIDIFVLDGEDDAIVGIQVKRYRGKISAEQIRSFVGALLLKGLTTGIYVTTGAYEKGAHRTAASAGEKLRLGVTLLDARRFYEALKITARIKHWNTDDPSAPYHQCWSDINAYIEGFRNRTGFLDGGPSSAWPNKAEYVWGSSW